MLRLRYLRYLSCSKRIRNCSRTCRNDKEIQKCIKDNNIALENVKIVNSNSVITMHDDAKAVLKEKADSSMGIGFKLLNEGEGDAFVSAGNTGCVTVGSTLITKRIKGVKRPAIASVMPSAKKPFLLMDCGANAECRAEFLYQFGKWEAFICKNYESRKPKGCACK